MPTYILLTTYNADAVVDPQEIGKMDTMVKKQVCAQCKGVEWIDSYLLLGRYDALDIFRAPDNTTASKAAVIIRSFGHAHTEVLPATGWSDFAAAIEKEETAEDADRESGENLNQGTEPGEKVSIGGDFADHEEAEESIEDEIDEAMVESFPASDPPSYTPG